MDVVKTCDEFPASLYKENSILYHLSVKKCSYTYANLSFNIRCSKFKKRFH